MPRTEIDLPRTVERLSILGEDGELDEDLLLDLPITVPVASRISHPVGLAYGVKHSGSDEVVLVFVGDGPSLIERGTHRLSLHATAADPTRYRIDEERCPR